MFEVHIILPCVHPGQGGGQHLRGLDDREEAQGGGGEDRLLGGRPLPAGDDQGGHRLTLRGEGG